MSNLNTENPEQLIYQNQILTITALGGIRIGSDVLDRMRVTLKVEVKGTGQPPMRHNLDLYNDTQVEKLMRKAATKLEIGLSVIEASLSELINQLEEYRLNEIEKSKVESEIKVTLTSQEVRAAQAFLEEPNLLERTNQLIGKSGVVGEVDNRLLMYLIFTSRKMATPLHVVSLGASGTGKTHLQEKVGDLIPTEDKLEITSLSENAFYYFGQRQLQNKLILIEDLDGAESVLYPLRELQSKKKISKTVVQKSTKGETRTIHLQVEGPVSVAGCTTKEKIYEDNANRSFLIYLDESPEQDQRIMSYQQRAAAGLVDSEAEIQAQELLRNVQRILEPVKVINPYAEQLCLPSSVLKPRRTNGHYLQFIAAVTFYCQRQRQKQYDTETGEEFIETTLEDIEAANQLLKTVLLRKSDELSGACRNYFERLKSWLKEEGKTTFNNSEARVALRENHSNQKRYNLQLQQLGLTQKGKGNQKKGFHYEVVSMEEYEKLKQGIGNVLDNALAALKTGKEAVYSSQAVQLVSEPLKANTAKKNSKQFTTSQKVQVKEKSA